VGGGGGGGGCGGGSEAREKGNRKGKEQKRKRRKTQFSGLKTSEEGKKGIWNHSTNSRDRRAGAQKRQSSNPGIIAKLRKGHIGKGRKAKTW